MRATITIQPPRVKPSFMDRLSGCLWPWEVRMPSTRGRRLKLGYAYTRGSAIRQAERAARRMAKEVAAEEARGLMLPETRTYDIPESK